MFLFFMNSFNMKVQTAFSAIFEWVEGALMSLFFMYRFNMQFQTAFRAKLGWAEGALVFLLFLMNPFFVQFQAFNVHKILITNWTVDRIQNFFFLLFGNTSSFRTIWSWLYMAQIKFFHGFVKFVLYFNHFMYLEFQVQMKSLLV